MLYDEWKLRELLGKVGQFLRTYRERGDGLPVYAAAPLLTDIDDALSQYQPKKWHRLQAEVAHSLDGVVAVYTVLQTDGRWRWWLDVGGSEADSGFALTEAEAKAAGLQAVERKP